MDEATRQREPQKRSAFVRACIWGAALVTTWHIFATLLWVFPYTPVRDAIPGGNKTLTSYMIPMFGQSWSVFAPQPARSELRLSVRAVIEDASGFETETDWVDADRIELATTTYNLFPSYGAVSAEKLAHTHNSGYYYLDSTQREIVKKDFQGTEWLAELKNELQSSPGNSVNYLASEENITAYSTQVAKAVWGNEGSIVRIQYLVTDRLVTAFEDRKHGELMRPDAYELTTGWRPPVVREGQDEAEFAATFGRWYAEYEALELENEVAQ